ncbi:zinc-binding dehydrogenase [Naumannella cuiyingiana]|uniref:zinc-binding dehydrogenase n=1 Tax=Naumannella cuiyingiana TaxID=1347891 RepID=UPI0015CE209E
MRRGCGPIGRPRSCRWRPSSPGWFASRAKAGASPRSSPIAPGAILAAALPGRTSTSPEFDRPSRRHLNELARLIDRGDLTRLIARRFPLTHIDEAHHHLETDPTPGKRVIDIVT